MRIAVVKVASWLHSSAGVETLSCSVSARCCANSFFQSSRFWFRRGVVCFQSWGPIRGPWARQYEAGKSRVRPRSRCVWGCGATFNLNKVGRAKVCFRRPRDESLGQYIVLKEHVTVCVARSERLSIYECSANSALVFGSQQGLTSDRGSPSPNLIGTFYFESLHV